MSYSLDLFFKPAIRGRRALEHFAKRRHYKIAGDDVCYEHPHTGVSSSMKIRSGRNVLLQRTVVSAAFEINYARPTYFGLEAERELTAFVAAFRQQIADPQIKGMGEGPYSGEGFLNGWNFGNVFCVGAALPHIDEAAIERMPGEQLRAVWAWNYRLDERRDKYENRAFVPKITLTRIDGRASRVVVWPRGMPVLLPRVDHVLVGRNVAGEKRFGLARWPEIVEVARRAGFDTAADPLDLEYFVTPPEIAEWVANIPLIDLVAYERLGAYQILDDELIAAARQSAERDEQQLGAFFKSPRPHTGPLLASAQGETAMPSFDQTPDVPEAFGYKVSWFAVKASDPASVLDALEFGEAVPANWASGLAAVYGSSRSDERWVFASPPVDGWVFLVGFSLPYPTVEPDQEIGAQFDLLFSRLMKRFDDVQFFGSHRVAGFVAWARALNGEPTRLFAFADEVMANFGAQTPEEAQLGFADLSGLSPSDACDKLFAVAEELDEERERLVASGLSITKRTPKFEKKVAAYPMRRMWSTLPRVGASIRRNCRSKAKTIPSVWDWRRACQRILLRDSKIDGTPVQGFGMSIWLTPQPRRKRRKRVRPWRRLQTFPMKSSRPAAKMPSLYGKN